VGIGMTELWVWLCMHNGLSIDGCTVEIAAVL